VWHAAVPRFETKARRHRDDRETTEKRSHA
jgi:hypothetical protein